MSKANENATPAVDPEKDKFDDMTTQELVDFFNERAGDLNLKTVTRFASVEKGRERCREVEGLTADDQPTPAEEKAPANPEETAQKISDATKKSWENPEVKAKRKARHGCLAYPAGTPEQDRLLFKSVRDAFVHYQLPLSKHIPFRAKVKALGEGETLEGFDLVWEVVSADELKRVLDEARAAEKAEADEKAEAEKEAEADEKAEAEKEAEADAKAKAEKEAEAKAKAEKGDKE